MMVQRMARNGKLDHDAWSTKAKKLTYKFFPVISYSHAGVQLLV
jgi:hypothetical protein